MKPLVLPIILLIVGCVTAHAQVYMVNGRQISGTDSIAIGNPNAALINPSGLGQLNSGQFSLQLLQLGFDVYSETLSRSLAGQFVFSGDPVEEQDKIDFKSILESQPFDITTQMDLNWVTLYFGNPKIGGFSLGLRDNIYGKGLLKGNQFLFLLNGRQELGSNQNWSQATLPASWNQSFTSFMHLRTIDLGYGRQLFSTDQLSLYAGLQYSKIFGIGLLDQQIENGSFAGNASFSSFYDISFSDIRQPGSALKNKLLSDAGKGQSISGGITMVVNDKLNLGAAILNKGSITWDKNVFATEGTTLDLSNPDQQNGIENFKLGDELDYLFEAFQYQQVPESITYDTRNRFRLNGFYKITSNFSMSVDYVTDLTTNEFYTPETSFVAAFDWEPLPRFSVFRVHSGILYHNIYGVRLPLGVSFQLGDNFKLLSVSTNDVLSLISNGIDPLASISISTVNLGW